MRISSSKRKAAAKKAARTRERNKAELRAAARKAAITRRRKRIAVAKKSSLKRSPI